MPSSTMLKLLAGALYFGAPVAPAHADQPTQQAQEMDIEFFKIDEDISLRRMVLGNASAKGTVLLRAGRRL